MKDEEGCRIITEFAAPREKIYAYKVQEDGYEIKDSGIKKAKGVTKSESKEVACNDFNKYVHNVANTSIIKVEKSFRSMDHNVLHCYKKQNYNEQS